ncbi:MAG: DUF2156 domain-containing protein [Parachlamydiaceae bacterium]|nr:DUF2156 domain-containing protein [Parachlamydiaceae bacterium]
MVIQENSYLVKDQPIATERDLHIEFIWRWGGSATNSILDPTTKIFTTPGVEGLIGYKDDAKCAVVYGDPVCASKDLSALSTAFHRYCTQLGKDIVYIATSKPFTCWAIDNNICGTSIEFGVELRINPQGDPRKLAGSSAHVLRSKVHQAERAGVTVHEYNGKEITLEKQIEEVAAAWLAGRKGPQVYIGNVNVFDDRVGKRWLYATLHGKIVGFVMLNQLKEHGGWFLDKLITNQAPNGTSELLVISAIDLLQGEGCQFLAFGLAPIAELGEIKGLGKFSTWLARKVYLISYRILNLAGRRKFWEKYHPECEPCYLLFSRKGLGISELIAIRQALNISF